MGANGYVLEDNQVRQIYTNIHKSKCTYRKRYYILNAV